MPSLKFDIIVDAKGGTLSMEQFGNETDRAFKKAGKAVEALSIARLPEHERAVLKVRNQYKDLESQIRKLESSGRITNEMATKWHNDLGVRMKDDLDSLEKKGTFTFASMSAAAKGFIASFVTLSAGVAVQDIVATTMKFQGMESALKTVTGSSAAAKVEMAYIRAEADRLGLSVITLADDYTKLVAASKGTSMEGQKTRDIFTAVTEAGRVLNLAEPEVSGALRSIQQMMSKGNVQAEELRGQLGERLPGAFQMAARAMGVTDAQLNKMLENGEVLAVDLLPKLAAELRKTFGPGVEDAADNAAASFARFENSVIELENAIGKSGLIDFFAAIAEGSAKAINGISGVDGVHKLRTEFELLNTVASATGKTFEGMNIPKMSAKLVFQEGTPFSYEERLKESLDSIIPSHSKSKTIDIIPNKKAEAAATEAKKAADQQAKDIDSTLARLLPLKKEQEEYAQDMAILNSQYAKGKISVAEYVTAQDNLIASTQEYKDIQEAAKQADKDAKEERDKLKKVSEAYNDAVLASLPEQEQAIAKVRAEFEQYRLAVTEGAEALGKPMAEMNETLEGLGRAEADAIQEVKEKTDELSQFQIQAFRNMETSGASFFHALRTQSDDWSSHFVDMVGDMVDQWTAAQAMMGLFGQEFSKGGELGGLLGMGVSALGGLFGGGGGITSAAAPGTSYVGAYDSFFSNPMPDFTVPSGAGGYDIPAGLNPLTQLHEEEMVLPAKYADVIRGIAQGGSSSSGAGSSPIYQPIINIDARGAEAGMEQKIRSAVEEGARRGYQMVKTDMDRRGPIYKGARS